jgi:hypothetical protein
VTRIHIAVLLALIAGWYLRVLAELDNHLFEGMVSMFGFLVLILLIKLAESGKP